MWYFCNVGVTSVFVPDPLTSPPQLNLSPSPQHIYLDKRSVAMRMEGTAVMRIIASRRASCLDAASHRADDTFPQGFGVFVPDSITSPQLNLSPSPQHICLDGRSTAMRTEGTAVMRIIASRRALCLDAASHRADDTSLQGFGVLVPDSTTSPHLNLSPSPQPSCVDGSSAAMRTQGTAAMRIIASCRASCLDAASHRAVDTSPPGFGLSFQICF